MQALLDDFGIPLQIGSSSSATKKKVRRVVGVACRLWAWPIQAGTHGSVLTNSDKHRGPSTPGVKGHSLSF